MRDDTSTRQTDAQTHDTSEMHARAVCATPLGPLTSETRYIVRVWTYADRPLDTLDTDDSARAWELARHWEKEGAAKSVEVLYVERTTVVQGVQTFSAAARMQGRPL